MKDAVHGLFGRTWRNLRAELWSNIGTVFAVGLAASIPLVFALAAWNLGRLVDKFVGQLEVVAYISVDASEAQIAAAAADIRRLPAVESVTVVTSEQALQRFAEELPDAVGVARELGENPLPPSLEIVLKPAYRDLPPTAEFTAQIQALTGVVEVDDGRQWIGRLNRLLRYLWMITTLMGLFLTSAAGLLVGHAIRLAIYRRREEIGIYRLVGATNRFIRGPLLLEGAAQGLAGAVVGLAICWALYRYAAYRLHSGDSLQAWLLGSPHLHWFPWTIALAAAAAGALLGLTASFLSTRRFLRI